MPCWSRTAELLVLGKFLCGGQTNAPTTTRAPIATLPFADSKWRQETTARVSNHFTRWFMKTYLAAAKYSAYGPSNRRGSCRAWMDCKSRCSNSERDTSSLHFLNFCYHCVMMALCQNFARAGPRWLCLPLSLLGFVFRYGDTYGSLCIAGRQESAACLLLALPCVVGSTSRHTLKGRCQRVTALGSLRR